MALRSGLERRWRAATLRAGRVPLRIKLITAVLALVAIALVAISVAGISFLRTYLLGQQDAALRAVSQTWAPHQVQVCLNGYPGCPADAPPETAVDWVPAGGTIHHVLVPVRGFVTGSQPQRLPGPAVQRALQWLIAHPGQATTVSAQSGDHRWRAIAYPANFPNPATPGAVIAGTVITSVDVTSVYDTVGRLVRIDLIVSGVVLAALAVIGIAIVRSSLRPLTDIERTARQIASGDLSRRVPERDPRTEVGRLGRALNMMLAQIEMAFHARAQSEAAARHSEERMRRFVADASHELRTPVTVIRGYAEYYRQRGGLENGSRAPGAAPALSAPTGDPAPRGTQDGDAQPGPTSSAGTGAASGPPPSGPPPSGPAPDVATAAPAERLTRLDMDRIMERVEQESARMGGMVEDLLLLARLDQQRPFESHPVDLLTLAVDAVQDARMIAPDRKIDLTVGSGTAFLVLGDAPRLRQVITNLMSNALTHTPEGTPVEVWIHAGDPGGRHVPSVIVEVADQGPGLTKEQADRVFERFYRADQARDRRTGGSGLGLAIVAALVAAHGGTAGVDTAPGKGATFRITLPLAPEARAQESQA